MNLSEIVVGYMNVDNSIPITDKCTAHSYLPLYQRLLVKKKKPQKMY